MGDTKGNINEIGPADSVNEFLNILNLHNPQEKAKTSFYRGQSDKDYGLRPSLFREDKFKTNEKELLEEFCSYFHEETRDKTTFEKLMQVQHYGLPTRLLDMTLNPLVALYFACLPDKRKDSSVYRFHVKNERILASSSDKLLLISRLALREKDREGIREGSGKTIDSKGISMDDLKKYFFIKPIYANPRIRAQSGGFVITGFIEKYEQLGRNEAHRAEKVIIPAGCKEAILTELDAMNINEMTLFPDMEHTAHYLKAKYLRQS